MSCAVGLRLLEDKQKHYEVMKSSLGLRIFSGSFRAELTECNVCFFSFLIFITRMPQMNLNLLLPLDPGPSSALMI